MTTIAGPLGEDEEEIGEDMDNDMSSDSEEDEDYNPRLELAGKTIRVVPSQSGGVIDPSRMKIVNILINGKELTVGEEIRSHK